MKKIIFSVALLAASFTTFAQVGVGTTNPDAALEIKTTGTTDTKALQIINQSNDSLFTVLDNGRVGIGTASPSFPLQVNNDASGINKQNRLRIVNYNQTVDWHTSILDLITTRGTLASPLPNLMGDITGQINIGQVRLTSYATQDHTATIRPDDLTINTLSIDGSPFAERVRVTSEGFVAIGTSTPSTTERLTVDGGAYVIGSMLSTNTIASSASSVNSWSSTVGIRRLTGERGDIQFDSNNNLNFYNTHTNGSFIFRDKNVGIGTTSPSVKLHVGGYIKVGSSDVSGDATPVAGMMRYNSTTDKFQGYVNDDGSGAAGWVDLN